MIKDLNIKMNERNATRNLVTAGVNTVALVACIMAAASQDDLANAAAVAAALNAFSLGMNSMAAIRYLGEARKIKELMKVCENQR